ncbi:MAG: hypothetical protein M3548_14960 [Actinomycetota bacterium]|nr:hypothetical protein [Actinomycetota bacterium]
MRRGRCRHRLRRIRRGARRPPGPARPRSSGGPLRPGVRRGR